MGGFYNAKKIASTGIAPTYTSGVNSTSSGRSRIQCNYYRYGRITTLVIRYWNGSSGTAINWGHGTQSNLGLTVSAAAGLPLYDTWGTSVCSPITVMDDGGFLPRLSLGVSTTGVLMGFNQGEHLTMPDNAATFSAVLTYVNGG
ncbi:MAG: hypothetical protein Pg6A_19970 [Termitinemataceae bacterium]|nr:MAG: hypothetical protein Pg6A_19970 [Termitinemataceae bacterium]